MPANSRWDLIRRLRVNGRRCCPKITHSEQPIIIYENVTKILKNLSQKFNPLNAELNPICHLLALLGAHHILHVSGIRVSIHGSVHRNNILI